MESSVKAAHPASPDVEFGVAVQTFGGGTFIVSTYGDVDLVTAPELEQELLEAVNEGARHVVVNLTKTTFFDSSGVHVLVRTGDRLESRGVRFGIVCANPRIKRILEITGIDRAVGIHDTIESAIGPRQPRRRGQSWFRSDRGTVDLCA